jgi:hypothetical protein
LLLVEEEPEGAQVILLPQEQAEPVLFVGHRGAMVALMEEGVQRELQEVVPEERPLLMELEAQEADCPAAAEQQVLVEEY